MLTLQRRKVRTNLVDALHRAHAISFAAHRSTSFTAST
jgi:hypothetical protein